MFRIKLMSLLLLCAVSVFTAVHFTDAYVIQTAAKQKSITEAYMENRFQEAMREAEERALAELAEVNVTIITEMLETKPPVTEIPPETEPTEYISTETEPTEEHSPETIPTDTEYADSSADNNSADPQPVPPVTSYRRGGLLPEDRSGVKTRSLLTLSKAENDRMMDFLIEHYFLDGYAYASRESNPELRTRKRLAAEMQGYITDSLNLVMSFLDISDPAAILSADFAAIIAESEDIKSEFAEKYSDSEQYGEQFEQFEQFRNVYDSGIAYFDRLIAALTAVKTEADNFAAASNPLVAALMLAGAIDNVLLPEIFETLESSYDITEICQEIFLEGTQGAWLLTRSEVVEVFLNPGLALG